MNSFLSNSVNISNVSLGDVFENSIDAQILLHGNAILDTNLKALEVFGINSKKQIKNLHPSELSPLKQPDGEISYLKAERKIALCFEEGSCRFNWVHQKQNGQLFNAEVTLSRFVYLGKVLILSSVRVLSLFDNSQKVPPSIFNYNEYQRFVHESLIVSKTDVNGIITYVNDNFCSATGYHRDELVGNTHKLIGHPNTPRSVFKEMWNKITFGDTWRGVICNQNKAGKVFYVDTVIYPLKGNFGVVEEYISIRIDISFLVADKLDLHFVDEVSELPTITKMRSQLYLGNYRVGVLEFREIGKLEIIYDRYEFIVLIGEIVKVVRSYLAELNSANLIYRISDHEVAFLIDSYVSKTELEQTINELILFFSSSSLNVNQKPIPLTVNCGLSSDVKHSDQIKQARLALDTGINEGIPLVFYSDNNKSLEKIKESLFWAERVREVIHRNRVHVFGQGIFDKHRNLYSTELLMRYDDGESNFNSPFPLIENSKISGCYEDLSLTFYEKAFDIVNANKGRFSINLDNLDILNPRNRGFVLSGAAKLDDPSRLTIELVESENIDFGSATVREFLREIKSLGVHIALDDFGSGYSNFSHFASFQYDHVKVDGSLIRDVVDNSDKRMIFEALIGFCKNLNTKVVAEYVENHHLYDYLHSKNVDFFQGFFLSKPALIERA